jgi:three-Cys-motif partner protein
MDENEDFHEFGGPWTTIKIEILNKYLNAYTTALKYQPSRDNHFELIYIDAFAGAGKYKIKQKPTADKLFETEKCDDSTIKIGSARAALEIKNPFHEYFFSDTSEQNIAHLHRLKSDFPELADRIHVQNADAGKAILDICSRTNWRMKRAVLFLDPFNLEISWPTIETIAATKAIDMWFLFPISAVNRMLVKSGVIEPGWELKLNDVFGTDSWKKHFYKASGQMSIFSMLPEDKTQKIADFDGIKKYTTDRLKSVFAGVAPNPRVLRNQKNSPLFVLFFAVSNDRGKATALRIANYILNNT